MCVIVLITGCVRAWRKALKGRPGSRGQYWVKLCRFVNGPVGFSAAAVNGFMTELSCWTCGTLGLTQESLEDMMVHRSWYGDGDDFAVVLQRAPLIAEPPSVSVSPPPLPPAHTPTCPRWFLCLFSRCCKHGNMGNLGGKDAIWSLPVLIFVVIFLKFWVLHIWTNVKSFPIDIWPWFALYFIEGMRFLSWGLKIRLGRGWGRFLTSGPQRVLKCKSKGAGADVHHTMCNMTYNVRCVKEINGAN